MEQNFPAITCNVFKINAPTAPCISYLRFFLLFKKKKKKKLDVNDIFHFQYYKNCEIKLIIITNIQIGGAGHVPREGRWNCRTPKTENPLIQTSFVSELTAPPCSVLESQNQTKLIPTTISSKTS